MCNKELVFGQILASIMIYLQAIQHVTHITSQLILLFQLSPFLREMQVDKYFHSLTPLAEGLDVSWKYLLSLDGTVSVSDLISLPMDSMQTNITEGSTDTLQKIRLPSNQTRARHN
jgi:hypothetical protein